MNPKENSGDYLTHKQNLIADPTNWETPDPSIWNVGCQRFFLYAVFQWTGV